MRRGTRTRRYHFSTTSLRLPFFSNPFIACKHLSFDGFEYRFVRCFFQRSFSHFVSFTYRSFAERLVFQDRVITRGCLNSVFTVPVNRWYGIFDILLSFQTFGIFDIFYFAQIIVAILRWRKLQIAPLRILSLQPLWLLRQEIQSKFPVLPSNGIYRRIQLFTYVRRNGICLETVLFCKRKLNVSTMDTCFIYFNSFWQAAGDDPHTNFSLCYIPLLFRCIRRSNV